MAVMPNGLIEKAVVAVPARLQSSRLPNKVLAEIGGQSPQQRSGELLCEQCCENEHLEFSI